ncbi:MAG: FecR domain-containing protein [Bacteroidota bacterium]
MENLITKYLTGSITEEELELLVKMLEIPENQLLFKESVKAQEKLDTLYRYIDAKNAHDKVAKSIDNRRGKLWKTEPSLFKYAAILIMGISISATSYLMLKRQDHRPKNSQVTLSIDGDVQQVSQHTTTVRHHGIPVAKQELGKLIYKTLGNNESISSSHHKLMVPYGRQFEVVLSDGTSVLLNAGSTLEYPQSFQSLGMRNVVLEGEAYFKVQKNKSQPFMVITEGMGVLVTGTKFNVSNYKNENQVTVFLEEGGVSIFNRFQDKSMKSGVDISPGQKAALKGNEVIVEKADIKKHLAWTEGVLHFENEPFHTIIKKLERHYNVTITNNHIALNETRYTGRFVNQPISEILGTFKRNTIFHFKESDGTIVISPASKNNP